MKWISNSLEFGLSLFPEAPRMFQSLVAPRRTAILMYHAIVAEQLPVDDWCFLARSRFEEQMAYLRDWCQVVRLNDIPFHRETKGRRPIVAVTFDDGFQNNYDVAFPILKDFNIPATIFLATGLVGTADTVWFCRINQALTNTTAQLLDWEGMKLDLSSPSARRDANRIIQAQLKKYPHDLLVENASQLHEALGCRGNEPLGDKSPYRMLGANEILEMSNSGLIDFGAHTCSHAILSGLSTSRRQDEIRRSVADVAELTGKPCTLFAYPNGAPSDYGTCDLDILREQGIASAVTTIDGSNDNSTPALELRRYGIGSDTSLPRFSLMTHHVLSTLRMYTSRYARHAVREV